jgi:hypothetical protein
MLARDAKQKDDPVYNSRITWVVLKEEIHSARRTGENVNGHAPETKPELAEPGAGDQISAIKKKPPQGL